MCPCCVSAFSHLVFSALRDASGLTKPSGTGRIYPQDGISAGGGSGHRFPRGHVFVFYRGPPRVAASSFAPGAMG